MRLLKSLVVAASLALSVAALSSEAFARGFHHSHRSHHFHHFHHGFHRHGHFGHWGRHFHHYHHRFHHYRYHYHYRYGYHYHWRHHSYGVAVSGAPRACPPGYHLGYLGRYCHPN
ncbi:hypothetical protein [Methylocapsa acidiphila]|uniref:hypothetical protein n=1 Tax=Methylocapsa acidiphila TaxID=133552 RepID=UPI001AEBE3EF|nr:hypothetical protein [Methylocapsa acidiphila]